MATEPAAAASRRTKRGAQRTQAERTALSDRKMLEAACELIGERGCKNTTLREIGERAGYSRGLASNRFGSKEALFGVLLTFLSDQWLAELRYFVGERTGLDALLAAFEALQEFVITQPTHLRAMYILWYESIASHPDLLKRLSGQHSEQRRDIRTWIAQGMAERRIDPRLSADDLATQHCAVVFGLIYQWLVNPAAIDVAAGLRSYRQAVLRAIATRPADRPGTP